MSFTIQDVLTELREQIQDTDPTIPRNSDAFCVRKINQAIKRLCIVRPDLFSATTMLPMVSGQLQTGPADSMRIIDLLSTSNGVNIKEINQDTLDMMFPAWPNMTPGVPQNWMRYVRDPNRFFVFPPAIPADTVEILYAKSPPVYAITDTVVLQDVYFPLVVDCSIWLLESIDAEHVESGRAKMFQDSFMAGWKSGLDSRQLTDSPNGGENPKDVL